MKENTLVLIADPTDPQVWNPTLPPDPSNHKPLYGIVECVLDKSGPYEVRRCRVRHDNSEEPLIVPMARLLLIRVLSPEDARAGTVNEVFNRWAPIIVKEGALKKMLSNQRDTLRKMIPPT
ncbi:MAG: hypothetical protein HYT49_01705 [Candidatus Wildermuthbacteria bacterium]|nr:hypothetical protein [Candidatus Wildermuthbacteria bacterium]